MPDKYDEAVTLLAQEPDFRQAVARAWNYPYETPGGCLFAHVKSSPEARRLDGRPYGCLTQIRQGRYPTVDTDYQFVAETDSLTQRIQNDERIPNSPDDITLDHLPVFVEWQRIIDQELGRV